MCTNILCKKKKDQTYTFYSKLALKSVEVHIKEIKLNSIIFIIYNM